MDVERKFAGRRRRIRRTLYALGALSVLGTITMGLSRLERALPTVQQSAVWVDTVKRGQMIRQVRGPGTLVPEEILWIPAATQGRVERILVQPGAMVQPTSVLLELSNPELELEALDAKLQLGAAEADYTDLEVRLASQLLEQKARAASVRAEYTQAKLRADAEEELAREGLISELTRKINSSMLEELASRHAIEQDRLDIGSGSIQAQLAAQRARIEQLRALYQLRQRQLHSLQVRAGTTGIVQEMLVEVGQQLAPGTNLARVANPEKLKARLRIPQTQVQDVRIGQKATIDTWNDLIAGRVTRIDPAVREGTVTVDVALEEALPKGARPDLNVDGTIEIERLDDALYVGRPAYGQEDATLGLFKLTEAGQVAVRVPVRFGRSSVHTIEIQEGLEAGDEVILSDMSAWDAFDRVQLN
jgi:HlyD family secretion protein